MCCYSVIHLTHTYITFEKKFCLFLWLFFFHKKEYITLSYWFICNVVKQFAHLSWHHPKLPGKNKVLVQMQPDPKQIRDNNLMSFKIHSMCSLYIMPPSLAPTDTTLHTHKTKYTRTHTTSEFDKWLKWIYQQAFSVWKLLLFYWLCSPAKTLQMLSSQKKKIWICCMWVCVQCAYSERLSSHLVPVGHTVQYF